LAPPRNPPGQNSGFPFRGLPSLLFFSLSPPLAPSWSSCPPLTPPSFRPGRVFFPALLVTIEGYFFPSFPPFRSRPESPPFFISFFFLPFLCINLLFSSIPSFFFFWLESGWSASFNPLPFLRLTFFQGSRLFDPLSGSFVFPLRGGFPPGMPDHQVFNFYFALFLFWFGFFPPLCDPSSSLFSPSFTFLAFFRVPDHGKTVFWHMG